ncbi:MAG TPA: MotA/TolQ/ExbB proton channel family protein [Elusimicrobiales bacterium]|nr:MotA/TolQ/ExbB proton channel family protein [Elusimicrobiales bacterium]
MDIGLIAGLLLGIGSVVGSFMWEGGKMSALIQGPAMLVIFGGTIATTLIGMPFKKFINGWRIAAKVLVEPKESPQDLIKELVAGCEKARREGLLALQKDVKNMKNPFTQKYMKMFINGTEPVVIAEMASVELEHIRERHAAGTAVFTKMGGYSPTMGVIGTVMGLISTFSHAGGDAAKLVQAIAGAFIATFWGVAIANLVFLPIGDKLKNKHQEESLLHAITLDGIAFIQAGYTPKIVSTRLVAMLASKDQAMAEVGPSEKDFAEVVERD